MLLQEEQVTPLEQSQELHKLRFRLNTQWYWVKIFGKWHVLHKRFQKENIKRNENFPAPTVAELGVILLPAFRKINCGILVYENENNYIQLSSINLSEEPFEIEFTTEEFETEAQSKGAAVIWLAKEKLITPSEVKL